MPIELDPRVRHFQEVKRKNKIAAIKRKEEADKLNLVRQQIRMANPVATDNQVESILQAHLKAKQARTIVVNNKTVKVYNNNR
jgi:hypothetical protein